MGIFDKKLGMWDVALVKWAVFTFLLFVLTIWPITMGWIALVNPWIYFALFILFSARPFYRVYLK